MIVDTDGAVQFKDFILNGPTHIVVDLAGVRSTMGSRTIAVASDLVDAVRVRDGSLLIIIIGEEGSAAGSSGSR